MHSDRALPYDNDFVYTHFSDNDLCFIRDVMNEEYLYTQQTTENSNNENSNNENSNNEQSNNEQSNNENSNSEKNESESDSEDDDYKPTISVRQRDNLDEPVYK